MRRSALPENMALFQGHGRAADTGNQSWREIRGRPVRGYGCAVHIARVSARATLHEPHSIHGLAHRLGALERIGVELNCHRIGLELAEEHSYFEQVLRVLRLDRQLPEAGTAPLLRQSLPVTQHGEPPLSQIRG